MQHTHLTAALSCFRELFSRLGCRFQRLRCWSPERVALGLILLVSRRDLTSIESLMSESVELFGLPCSPSDSTFVEARKKFAKQFPQAMRQIWQDLVGRAVELVAPAQRVVGELQWVAIDGTWAWAPHTAGIVARWGRPKAGAGKLLHYPQFLLVTALDVLTRVPLAAAVLRHDGSERVGLRSFIDTFHAGMVAMVDRGFPAKDLLWALVSRQADLLWRMNTADANAWECVWRFLKDRSKPREADVTIRLTPAQGAGEAREVRVRLIRRVFNRGRPKRGQKREAMVLMTTLLDAERWPAERLIAMYERRWVIEDWYRDIKVRFRLESFHARSDAGVEQEIHALLAWMTLCAIVEQAAFQRVMISRGPQDPEDPERFQLSRANLFTATARMFMRLLILGDLDQAMARSETDLRWLDSTARRRRPGRSSPRVRQAPHGRWNG